MEDARTVGQALGEAGRRLADHGFKQGRLEAEVLLAHVLRVPRHWFYAHPDQSLSPQQESQFQELIARRLTHEPVAYLTGEKEFFSLTFEVDRSVLIPRPETELVVEAALEMLRAEGRGSRAETEPPVFFDVGTGAGPIAIAILANCRACRGFASDVSPAALEVARRNAAKHGVADRLEYVEGDLFGSFEGRVDVVVCNPPYVRETDRATLPTDVRDFEPAEALFDSGDGLSVIRRVVRESHGRLRSGGWLILEVGMSQDNAVWELLQSDGRWTEIETRNDLAGIARVILARRGRGPRLGEE